jgi:hypothetical protein
MNQADKKRCIEVLKRIPEGRELLEGIDDFCGYQKCVFNPQSERQSNFNQGKQAVAVWLHSDESRKYKPVKEKKKNEELDENDTA